MPAKRKKTVRSSQLEKKIQHQFKNKEFLKNALTHSSALPENEERKSYETLEFFGDSILSFVISEMIYRRNSDLSEGEMTRIRSMIVSSKSLAEAARKLDMGKFILFGKGEEMTGGSEKESILAGTFEALVAAIYLDAGIVKVKRFLREIFGNTIIRIMKTGKRAFLARDSKSVLQELLHKRGAPLPEYVVTKEEGPAHNKRFYIELRLAGDPIAEASGRTKKEAEKEAAAKALALIPSLGM